MNIKLEGADEIIKRLKQLEAKGNNLTDILSEVANKLKNITEQSFINQSSPDGSSWTAKRYNNGKKILIDSSDLSRISMKVKGREATVFSDRVYATIHQFGGKIEAKRSPYLKFKIGDRYVQKKSVTIPARPFLPIDSTGKILPNVEKEIIKMLEEWLNE